MSLEQLDSDLVRSVPAEFCCLERNGAAGIVKSHDSAEFGRNLLQNFQPFSSEIADSEMDAGQTPERVVEQALRLMERMSLWNAH